MELNITDVRALPGDAAFLLDDGKNTVLYDTGFAFTGYRVAENIQKILGNRSLDLILLTHSHYDHAAGSAYIRRVFPNVRVAAGVYTAEIFARPGARDRMRALDQKAAVTNGIIQYEDLFAELRVDTVLSDGECFACGNMEFVALSLPGHTKCSMGFYMPAHKLLLGSETLGVYFGADRYLPSCLVGYDMTLASFARVEEIDPQVILVPHYGVLRAEDARRYLYRCKEETVQTVEYIRKQLQAGQSREEILASIKQRVYMPQVAPVYPIDAFLLNTSLMIDLVAREM